MGLLDTLCLDITHDSQVIADVHVKQKHAKSYRALHASIKKKSMYIAFDGLLVH